MYSLTFRRVRIAIVAVELSGVKIASFLRRVMLPSVACLSVCLAVPDLLTLYRKRPIFEKNIKVIVDTQDV
jgi:hypothetical protein